MLKKLLNTCLIFCVIGLAPIAMAAEEISTVEPAQQSEPEKSSRIFGGGSGACILHVCPHLERLIMVLAG